LRVRANLAFDNTRFLDEFDVDETEPGWAGMLEEGYLTPVDDHVAHDHETRGWKPGDPPVDVDFGRFAREHDEPPVSSSSLVPGQPEL
jgi:hypothetical protein